MERWVDFERKEKSKNSEKKKSESQRKGQRAKYDPDKHIPFCDIECVERGERKL
jgi:hypothetical protein